MGINFDQIKQKLHTKLDSGIDQLKSAQAHLEDLQNRAEAATKAKLSAAKEAMKEKKQEASAAGKKIEEYAKTKMEETEATVSEWKMSHNLKKLEKRAERAGEHAESSVDLALYYAAEAQVAILEAVAARQDADDAS